jgi:hypothetical protein
MLAAARPAAAVAPLFRKARRPIAVFASSSILSVIFSPKSRNEKKAAIGPSLREGRQRLCCSAKAPHPIIGEAAGYLAQLHCALHT